MRGLSKATIELIRFARQLLAADYPMTLRQLHYVIFSAAIIAYGNTQADYKRLSRVTTIARRAYRDWENDGDSSNQTPPANSIPPDWMVDETRKPETQNVFDGAEAYIETVERAYRRDNWQTQPMHCEVWSEKGTTLGSLRPVAAELGITLRVCHGYGSCGMEMQVGDDFRNIKKPIHIFYLGDHDPSGHDIERAIHQQVERASGVKFSMHRLAIHAADIAAFNLPPQLVKDTDVRAPKFRDKYGLNGKTVELDALPPSELRRRVSEAVKGLMDMELWNQSVALQKVEQDSILEGTELMRELLGTPR